MSSENGRKSKAKKSKHTYHHFNSIIETASPIKFPKSLVGLTNEPTNFFAEVDSPIEPTPLSLRRSTDVPTSFDDDKVLKLGWGSVESTTKLPLTYQPTVREGYDGLFDTTSKREGSGREMRQNVVKIEPFRLDVVFDVFFKRIPSAGMWSHSSQSHVEDLVVLVRRASINSIANYMLSEARERQRTWSNTQAWNLYITGKIAGTNNFVVISLDGGNENIQHFSDNKFGRFFEDQSNTNNSTEDRIPSASPSLYDDPTLNAESNTKIPFYAVLEGNITGFSVPSQESTNKWIADLFSSYSSFCDDSIMEVLESGMNKTENLRVKDVSYANSSAVKAAMIINVTVISCSYTPINSWSLDTRNTEMNSGYNGNTTGIRNGNRNGFQPFNTVNTSDRVLLVPFILLFVFIGLISGSVLAIRLFRNDESKEDVDLVEGHLSEKTNNDEIICPSVRLSARHKGLKTGAISGKLSCLKVVIPSTSPKLMLPPGCGKQIYSSDSDLESVSEITNSEYGGCSYLNPQDFLFNHQGSVSENSMIYSTERMGIEEEEIPIRKHLFHWFVVLFGRCRSSFTRSRPEAYGAGNDNNAEAYDMSPVMISPSSTSIDRKLKSTNSFRNLEEILADAETNQKGPTLVKNGDYFINDDEYMIPPTTPSTCMLVSSPETSMNTSSSTIMSISKTNRDQEGGSPMYHHTSHNMPFNMNNSDLTLWPLDDDKDRPDAYVHEISGDLQERTLISTRLSPTNLSKDFFES
eukprot:CAMPEP_0194303340 /NCGR_PEP_ID=MMETSP0171-20130528/1218_1 /TAXON_ID=218684 /ORGANISM="Corethron pennatum, Strain L29A3" /LENGTH=748 /DNA_ID=CAMNT_0039054193 /DNA_START=257 /DNA_END=2503 /DNA_ORIENTATION=-